MERLKVKQQSTMGRNSSRSGRGSGRGRGAGRGGRGTGSQTRVKKTLSENIFYTGAVTQASDFVVVKKFLLNFIKKTYQYGDDIGEALIKGEEQLNAVVILVI